MIDVLAAFYTEDSTKRQSAENRWIPETPPLLTILDAPRSRGK
jgi:hypothetical protein